MLCVYGGGVFFPARFFREKKLDAPALASARFSSRKNWMLPRDFFGRKKLDAPARFFPPEKIEMFFFHLHHIQRQQPQRYNGTTTTSEPEQNRSHGPRSKRNGGI